MDARPAPQVLSDTPPMAGSESLRGQGLCKRYRKRAVVQNATLSVNRGEIVGLLGPNGAGKTTTFLMFVGLIRPDEGRIHLRDIELTHQPMFRRARYGIGYLPQEASVFRSLTVRENIECVLQFQRMSSADRKRRVDELIEEFRLGNVQSNKGFNLSGGERRRTEIARALATRPSFILLDEPFAGVDPIAVEDIQEIVTGLRRRNIGILITDHNVHETLAITDRAYLMYEGRILKEGTAESLASDEEARRLYLGKQFTLERYRPSEGN